MKWKEQFDIFEKIISKRLAENGEKFTQARAAELLGVPLNKYRAWKNGQRPVVEDMRMLAQDLEFEPKWLLLGVGNPVQPRRNHAFNRDYVEICDTLHEMVRALPDPLPKVAEVGGMTTTDLYDCIHTQAFPPTSSVAKWVRHYRFNANFLLAQIGQPFLSDAEYNESGPLDFVRERRGDYVTLHDEDDGDATHTPATHGRDSESQIMALQQELLDTQRRLIAAINELRKYEHAERSLEKHQGECPAMPSGAESAHGAQSNGDREGAGYNDAR